MNYFTKYIKYKNKYLKLKASQLSTKYTRDDSTTNAHIFLENPSELWMNSIEHLCSKIYYILDDYLKQKIPPDNIIKLFSTIPKSVSDNLARCINRDIYTIVTKIKKNILILPITQKKETGIIWTSEKILEFLSYYNFKRDEETKDILKNIFGMNSSSRYVQILNKTVDLILNYKYVTIWELINYIGKENIIKLFLYLPIELFTYTINISEEETDETYAYKVKYMAHIHKPETPFKIPTNSSFWEDVITENPQSILKYMTIMNTTHREELIEMGRMQHEEYLSRREEYLSKIKLKYYTQIAIDLDPNVFMELWSLHKNQSKYYSQIYTEPYVKYFEKDFSKMSLYDIWSLYRKNKSFKSFFEYLPSHYETINFVVKFICESKIDELDIALSNFKKIANDFIKDIRFNKFCIRQYLMGFETELPSYMTTDFILSIFNS